MGVLSGGAIADAVARGAIKIDPYDPDRLAPNSYDCALGDRLLVYRKHLPLVRWFEEDRSGPPPLPEPLDTRVEEDAVELTVGPDGFTVWPGVLYLGATAERITCPRHVPCVEGRSSVARVGVFTHVSAGWGDVGFDGHFTLEIVAPFPVHVYRGMRACQVSFTEVAGEARPYAGKYQGNTGPQKSGIWRDFRPNQ